MWVATQAIMLRRSISHAGLSRSGLTRPPGTGTMVAVARTTRRTKQDRRRRQQRQAAQARQRAREELVTTAVAQMQEVMERLRAQTRPPPRWPTFSPRSGGMTACRL